ncbi:uncharacterized protein LOC141588481 [Silene latifolia]|uniref:uncharacterized protein LOC141588481 n=1 Tax=Silene latifolia TaxID=37657 RepID=UPI003D77C88B
MEKKDTIWVQWVECNYLKGQQWTDYFPSPNSSWVWRRICRVKHEIAHGYTDGIWHQQEGFSSARCYDWLKGQAPKMLWEKVVWTGWSLPKHNFLGWLWAHGALQTKSKLLNYGVVDEDTCQLCGMGSESQEHLFFDCPYSRRVIQQVKQSSRLDISTTNALEWCVNMQGSAVQKGVQYAMVVSAVYVIWQQRNTCRQEMVLARPEWLAKRILNDMKARIRERDKSHLSIFDVEWLESKNLM